jgi:SAM-dependent MidA family methyltransferase
MTILKPHIIEKIRQSGGKIPFSEYMQMALYDPKLGYYTAYHHQLGRQGDFITAPELSPLFGQCIAKSLQAVLCNFKNPMIVEYGAGTGKLAKVLLEQCDFIENYWIIEISPALRKQQEMNLAKYLSKITWLEKLADEKFEGVILANEVMDAFPVTKFCLKNNIIQEYYVSEKGGCLEWYLDMPSHPEIMSFVNHLELPSAYTSEINFAIKPWIKSLSDGLKSGVILLFDYGYSRHEYYHPNRNGGTLMCYYQHQSNTDPFYLPGLQDMTAHVDFTFVAESAVESGLEIRGYTSQAAFLLESGILDFSQSDEDNHAIKVLTLPSEMGELFKAMILSKNNDLPVLGFGLHDRRNRL